MSLWRDRLEVLREKHRVANSAESANSSAVVSAAKAIGTIGTIGNEVVAPRATSGSIAALSYAEALPDAPCPGCGCGVWWRLSVMSGGPGPWHCQDCIKPDVADWLDACAMPAASRR